MTNDENGKKGGPRVVETVVGPAQMAILGYFQTVRRKLVLSGGTTMEGKVVDADGNPRQGVQVQLKLGDMAVAWANTNQEGKFTFQFVPEGRTWRIEARLWNNGSWLTSTSEKAYASNATDAEVKLP